MRISDWSSDVCSSDLSLPQTASARGHRSSFQTSPCQSSFRRPDKEAWRPVSPPAPRGRRNLSDRRAYAQKRRRNRNRSEEHTSELQSLMRISYAVFCLKKKKTNKPKKKKNEYKSQ